MTKKRIKKLLQKLEYLVFSHKHHRTNAQTKRQKGMDQGQFASLYAKFTNGEDMSDVLNDPDIINTVVDVLTNSRDDKQIGPVLAFVTM